MMGSFDPPKEETMETVTLTDPFSSYGDHHSATNGAAASDPLLNPPSSRSSFVDPPSYADVIFNPFNNESDPNDVSNGSFSDRDRGSPPPPSTSDYLKITVSDPQKEQEPTANSFVPGSGAFVSYLITTKARGDPPAQFSVRRRFRDFVTLADHLAESHRGFFIPPRPDKSLVESQVMQKQEFVEQRRLALEKYLIKLVSHPVIGKSEELGIFLQAPGKLPLPASADVASRMLDGAVRLPMQLWGDESSGVVPPEEAVQPAKVGRDLLRMFKELKQAVANDWGGGRPPAVEEDREFLERKEKVQEMEQQLSTASQQAEAFVKAQQDIGETMGELGLAFVKLSNFETKEAMHNSQRTRAADFKHVATAAVRASRSYREANAQTVKHLDTLHEYLGLMLAVHSAFSDRSSALLTVQTLMSDLSSLHTRTEKLEAASSSIFGVGVDKLRIQKLEELKETIRKTEDAKSCAIREYERIKENNRSELERLDRERHDDFLGMLKGFVITQVGYAEKNAGIWAQAAEEIKIQMTHTMDEGRVFTEVVESHAYSLRANNRKKHERLRQKMPMNSWNC